MRESVPEYPNKQEIPEPEAYLSGEGPIETMEDENAAAAHDTAVPDPTVEWAPVPEVPTERPDRAQEPRAPYERMYYGVSIEFERPQEEIRSKVLAKASVPDTLLALLPEQWKWVRTRRKHAAVETFAGGGRVSVRITPKGAIRVTDGNTRMFTALEASVAPDQIPVTLLNGDPSKGEEYQEMTLGDAIHRAREEYASTHR